MKRIFFALGFILTAGLLFTSENPSLDGRAVVAQDGVFPKGLFAKTVGYLPGDSISVTNPANGDHIDILVIGSLDPTEGVAILLSPEAAEALSIRPNSNNLVKLTKRSGNADEVVNGSAVLTRDGEPAPEAETEAEPAPEVAEESVEEVTEEVAEVTEEPTEEGGEVAEAPAEEGAETTEVAEAVEVADAEETVEEEAEEVAEVSEEEETPVEEEIASAEEGSDDGLYPEYVPVTEEEFFDLKTDLTEERVSDEDNIAEEPVEKSEDEYDAIVLVPSDANPPEQASLSDAQPASEEKPVQTESAAGVKYISSTSELSSCKYYVQIAVYSRAENVESLSALYGNRYPLTVVDSGSKKTVMVGPLGVDEYGIILERFKDYGFKDAFVKFN